MTIGNINGYLVYKVTREDVNCTLSDFAKALEEWEEGERVTEISMEEFNAIKEKYKSDRMTEEESIQFFGDLVEAGILSKSSASMIYHGMIPLDLSDCNGTSQGTLKKYIESDRPQMLMTSSSGFTYVVRERSFDGYLADLKRILAETNVDVEQSQYFRDYNNFLGILDQIRRDQIVRK